MKTLMLSEKDVDIIGQAIADQIDARVQLIQTIKGQYAAQNQKPDDDQPVAGK